MKSFRFLFFALALTGLAWAPLGSVRADDATTTTTTFPTLPEKKKAPPLPAVFSKELPESVEDLKAIETQVKEVVKKVLPCTICIRVGGSSGSGIIISEDGYILTAGHVSGTPGRDCTIVMPDGKTLPGKTLGGNGTIDSGLVKIAKPGKYPFVEIGSSAEMKKNDWCVVTGHPGGFKTGRSPVVRVGRILEINTKTAGQFIRTDCTIVGGDSGGPLFDMNGRVIGIHSRIGGPITANLHVPVDTYRETWDRLVKSERWGNGIGRPVPATGDADFLFKLDLERKDGMISEILIDSPAYKAGLKAGDVIKKIQGKETATLTALQDELKKRRAGEEVTLDVQRGDEVVKVKFVVGAKQKT